MPSIYPNQGSGMYTAVNNLIEAPKVLGTWGDVAEAPSFVASVAIGTANVYRGALVRMLRTRTITKAVWRSGTAMAGNYDIGIFSADGATKLWSKGSTVVPATSTDVTETVSPSVVLKAGTDYVVALAFDTATSTFASYGSVVGPQLGRREDSSAIIFQAAITLPLAAGLTLTAVTGAPPAIALRTA